MNNNKYNTHNRDARSAGAAVMRPLVDLSDMPRLLTKPETAELLRLSPSSVDRLIAAGRLACVKLGRRVLVPRPALEALLSRPFNEAVLVG